MHQIIIGTAGHVDHGKTRLVKALTGIETDRLKEEKERGISIELGFAPLILPNGKKVGIVDVPGHEKFIKQMLAGVAGIDVVLMVIAADEGIMPQTQEHLDIVHLLQVKKGILVITKKDLVDSDWLEIMQMEIRDAVKGTVLEQAPMIAVSSATGDGLEELKNLIAKVADETSPKTTLGKPRMPIDRVFSITGFGTVVTGTLWSGTINIGDNVEILPKGISSKIRSLQVHGQKQDIAQAGQRVAANIAGVEVDEVERGSVLAAPDFLKHTYRFDAKISLLPNVEKNLKNLDRIRIYLGTKEVLGKIRLLDIDEMEPGTEAYAQIYLDNSLVAARNDRFIIRTYSPMHTIAGGTIIDLLPPKHKRFSSSIIENLKLKEKGDPKEILLEYLDLKIGNIVTPKIVSQELNMTQADTEKTIETLIKTEDIFLLGRNMLDGIVSKNVMSKWQQTVIYNLENYHATHSLKMGMSKEELRSRSFPNLESKIYNTLLEMWEKEKLITLNEQLVSTYDWKPKLTSRQEELINKISAKIKGGGLQPQSPWQVAEELRLAEKERDEILNYLISSGILIKGEENLYFHKDVIDAAIAKIIIYAKEHKGITLGEARDVLNSSRKYVLPILEYMDEKRITRRIGDKRIITSGN